MVDDSDHGDLPSIDTSNGGEDITVSSGAVTHAEIDDVVGDPTLSPAERQARLEDLRERMLDSEGDDYAGAFTPLETRIMDALSMLADGGHDYGSTETADDVEAGINEDDAAGEGSAGR